MVAVNICVNRMAVGLSRNKRKYAGGRNEKLEEEVDGFDQCLLSAVSVWVPVSAGATTAPSVRNCRSISHSLQANSGRFRSI
jgi:hypothetical protein